MNAISSSQAANPAPISDQPGCAVIAETKSESQLFGGGGAPALGLSPATMTPRVVTTNPNANSSVCRRWVSLSSRDLRLASIDRRKAPKSYAKAHFDGMGAPAAESTHPHRC